MAERLALPTSVHGVAGSNPAGGEILLEPKRRFIAQSLSCSPFHRLEMTEILLKGRKTLTHPSILFGAYCMVKPPWSKSSFSGVQIFRIFTLSSIFVGGLKRARAKDTTLTAFSLTIMTSTHCLDYHTAMSTCAVSTGNGSCVTACTMCYKQKVIQI